MEHLIHGFIITLLHSIWQSALLFLIYVGINFLVKDQLPKAKRNILYLILFCQVLVSAFTFFAYTSDLIPVSMLMKLPQQAV
jgi:hypothetical protein